MHNYTGDLCLCGQKRGAPESPTLNFNFVICIRQLCDMTWQDLIRSCPCKQPDLSCLAGKGVTVYRRCKVSHSHFDLWSLSSVFTRCFWASGSGLTIQRLKVRRSFPKLKTNSPIDLYSCNLCLKNWSYGKLPRFNHDYELNNNTVTIILLNSELKLKTISNQAPLLSIKTKMVICH